MATDGEAEQNALLRGIIASVVAGTGADLTQGAGGTESVAQLIAAAMTQLGHNIASFQEASEANEVADELSLRVAVSEPEATAGTPNDDMSINPVVAGFEEESPVHVGGASQQVEEKASSSGKPKQICVKLPIETRKRIIAMRKEGRKCKDIAKELKVSVSGAQKVWERFLATGKVHDRKPSEYAGRPRKPLAFAQVGDAEMPIAGTHHIHVGDTVDVLQGDEVPHVEYSTVAGGISDPPTTDEEAVVISGDSEIYVGGPLDMPGATVEIVETEPMPVSTPTNRKQLVKKKHEFREQLLLRLIEDCPLAVLREKVAATNEANPHVDNLSKSISRPLYMESVLGHPFGRVPVSKPYDGDPKEAEVILNDPANPVGKDLIAALGYSTKVYFNACCKPSPLFDPNKVLSTLPLCHEPGFLADSMHKVLQLFLDLSKNPLESLERLPEGDGPTLSVKTADGQVMTKKCITPTKLSDYWHNLYNFASLLECCENFLSASIPSAPCLLCHPFEKFAQTLEIKDQEESELLPSSLSHHPPPSSSVTTESSMASVHSVGSLAHQIEVQVLESGQVAMSSAVVTSDPTSTAPVTARENLSSVQALPTISSVPSKRGVSRRKRSNGSNSSSSRAVHDDIVEVDGQFDMPILPDSSTADVPTTASNTVMTFVMTSEGLAQATPREREKDEGEEGQQEEELDVVEEASGNQSQSLGADTRSAKVSVDAATQTVNGRLRSEVQYHTPLIIRRSHVGKTQKLATPPTTRKPTAQTETVGMVKSTESGMGYGNETEVPARQEVMVQTQLSPEIDVVSPEQNETMENQISSEVGAESSSATPRRSMRKSSHKMSPPRTSEAARAKVSPTARRSSPRKSPVGTSRGGSPQVTLQVRTRAAAKRSALKQQLEKDDIPPAKRTRKTVQMKSSEVEEHSHPQQWGVEQVADFISTFQSDCTDVFKEHEVDGESLFSLDPEMMVKLMNLKTGPALKIHRKILSLKKQFGILPSTN